MLQKYVGCKPPVVTCLWTSPIYKKRNVILFDFHFIQEMFSHTLGYFIGSKILSSMPWISQSSEIKSEIAERF